MKNKKVEKYGLVPVEMSKQALAAFDGKTKGSKLKGGANSEGFKAGKGVNINKGVKAQKGKKLIG